jgi:hypothetical protein
MRRSTEHIIFVFVVLLLITYARHGTSHLKILPQVQKVSVVCTGSACLCLCLYACEKEKLCIWEKFMILTFLHSPPASAEVKKTWIYTSSPPYAFMA